MNSLIARTITADGAPASAAAQANSQQSLKSPSDYDLTTPLDWLISGWDVPLLAYANRYAVRGIVTDESLHCA